MFMQSHSLHVLAKMLLLNINGFSKSMPTIETHNIPTGYM